MPRLRRMARSPERAAIISLVFVRGAFEALSAVFAGGGAGGGGGAWTGGGGGGSGAGGGGGASGGGFGIAIFGEDIHMINAFECLDVADAGLRTKPARLRPFDFVALSYLRRDFFRALNRLRLFPPRIIRGRWSPPNKWAIRLAGPRHERGLPLKFRWLRFRRWRRGVVWVVVRWRRHTHLQLAPKIVSFCCLCRSMRKSTTAR